MQPLDPVHDNVLRDLCWGDEGLGPRVQLTSTAPTPLWPQGKLHNFCLAMEFESLLTCSIGSDLNI